MSHRQRTELRRGARIRSGRVIDRGLQETTSIYRFGITSNTWHAGTTRSHRGLTTPQPGCPKITEPMTCCSTTNKVLLLASIEERAPSVSTTSSKREGCILGWRGQARMEGLGTSTSREGLGWAGAETNARVGATMR
jgi:hypothetical protein